MRSRITESVSVRRPLAQVSALLQRLDRHRGQHAMLVQVISRLDDMRAVLHGLTISSPDAKDVERISLETGFLPDEERVFFLLRGAHYEGYIVAEVLASCEDAGEYFEPSELWPAESPATPR